MHILQASFFFDKGLEEMTERETFEYIESLQALGSHLGLDSVKELCRRLGNPQDDLKFIHVAGTNGKGSIIAMISETLTVCGYKTGRYISPTISLSLIHI